MGKFISIFIAIILQFGTLLGGHIYYSNNPKKTAIVVEAAYGLNQYQTAIDKWITEYTDSARYQEIYYGTDKSFLGTGLSNKDSLFRVNFGTINLDNLENLYPKDDYNKRFLVGFSDKLKIDDWDIIQFSE